MKLTITLTVPADFLLAPYNINGDPRSPEEMDEALKAEMLDDPFPWLQEADWTFEP